MKRSMIVTLLVCVCMIGFMPGIHADNIDIHILPAKGVGPRSVAMVPVSADLSDKGSLTLSFLPSVTEAMVSIEDVSTDTVVYFQDWNSSSDLTIDVSGYESGAYDLEITIEGTVYEGKFDLFN